MKLPLAALALGLVLCALWSFSGEDDLDFAAWLPDHSSLNDEAARPHYSDLAIDEERWTAARLGSAVLLSQQKQHCKEQAARDLAAGKLDLQSAMQRFRDIDVACDASSHGMLKSAAGKKGNTKHYAQQVMVYTSYVLRNDDWDRAHLQARLQQELQEVYKKSEDALKEGSTY